jgi:hypothetical protein
MEAHMHRTTRTTSTTSTTRTTLWLSTVALAAGLSATQIRAQADGSALPMAVESGPVTVISGGVDLDEAERLKQASGRYPLRVVFSVPGGNYAVPEQFSLLQGGTTMVTIPSAGPWLLIDLPPGTYTMQARVDARVIERSVNVTRKGNTVYWQVPDASS